MTREQLVSAILARYVKSVFPLVWDNCDCSDCTQTREDIEHERAHVEKLILDYEDQIDRKVSVLLAERGNTAA